MDCQPRSSKSSKPHSKGEREASHHEVGSVRQDPQGEESHSSNSLASSPSVSSVSRAQLGTSGLSVWSAPFAARASRPSVNLPPTSIDHSNYVYCVSNMNDLLQNAAPASATPSSSSSTSGKRGSVHEDHLSSLLPKHFSEMSQNSQQAVLEQLLASAQSDVAGGSGKSHDAPLSASGIVVSLPSHGSSLNMPESPGPPNKNDSSGSVGSSNNTMVIHGSSSPDSPWSQQWSSSLLHNRGVSSAGSDAQRGKRASYDYHQHHSPATTVTSPELLRGGIERSDESVENLSSSSYLPSNSSYLPANSSYLPTNSSYLTTNSSYLASNSPYLAATTSNSYLPSYSSTANQSLNYATSLSQSLSSEMASRDQVLGYLGQSRISSIAHSALDQSEVLKHLLNSNTDASRTEGARRRPDEAATLGSLGASKLTCNSSSCGSVHSGGLDNVTPTSGYSSASASTQFSLNRSGSNHRGEGEQRAPPPAYTPNYALNRDVLLAREALRDISLGRGADLRDHKGRSAAREVRRDLSLGPEMTRRPRDSSGVQVSTRDSSAPPSTDSALSRSHPDLSRLEESREVQLSERLEASELPGVVDLLHRENTALRLELEIVSRKVNKLQKFEAEIVKMQAAHEGLVQSCSRREQLEKLARTKLQSQVQVLTRTNIDLREELEALRVARDPAAGAAGVGATSTTTRETEESLRRELNRRDVIVAQLIAQNKELLAAKERLQMEVTAQKKTLHEQRSHIEVLDSALASARLNVVKLEEEVRLKQGSVAELQLQAAADRRLQLLEARHERQLQDGSDRRDRPRERGAAHERQQHHSDRHHQQQPRSAAPRKDEELDAGLDGIRATASSGRASQPPSASLPLLHIHEADGPLDYADSATTSDHRMEDTSYLLKQGSVASARATPASDHGGPSSKGRPQDAEGSPAPWDHGDPPNDQDPSSEPVQLAQNHGKVSCSGSAAGLSVRSPSVHRSSTSPAHLFTHAREDGKDFPPSEQLRKSPFLSEPKMPCANTSYGRPSVLTSQKFRYSCEPEISNERVREQDDRDRSNYTQYISRQFNKFRDATLSKNMNPKRLSYPLKHELMESIRKVDESHGNDQVCGRIQQPSSSNIGFGPRPHSANDLPTSSTITSSGVHDYVNYCPGSCDQTRDISELSVPYVYPPDYGSRGSNKPSTDACERSNSFHSVTSNVRGNRHSYIQQQPESCLPQYPTAHPKKNSSYCENFLNKNFAETTLSNSRLKVPHVRLTPPPPSPNSAAPLHYDRYNDYAVVYDANQFSCESLMTSAMPVPRGNPPPYHSHHEILDSGPAARPVINTSGVVENPRPPSVSASVNHLHQSSSEFLNSSTLRNSPLTVTPAEMCQTNHPPSTTCKTCNNARSTYRKNAANLVRRASSGASLLKRKSAKLRSSFHTEVDLDESPSILSRLRKEWQDRKGGSKSTGNIPTLGGASETSTSTSSYLSPAASVKPPESLRFELSAFSRSLSKKKWIIQENQAVGPGSSASEGSYVMCNDHANTPPLERNSRGRPLSVESASSGAVSLSADETTNNERSVSQSSLCDSPSVPMTQTADPHQSNSGNCGGARNALSQSECHYYDVEMSDNDSTYDTLIIKNVSELNDSNTTVGCDCTDACSILSDPKHKTRTASKQHQADNVTVKS